MSSPDDKRPSAPPTPEEEQQARDRKRAVDDGDDELAELLVSSYRPHEIDAAVHEDILEHALAGGHAAPATTDAPHTEPPAGEVERRDADRLREALEVDPKRRDIAAPKHPLADLARAVKNAHAPSAIDELRNEALLRPALRTPTKAQNRRFVGATILGALAVAAAVAGLWLRGPEAPKPAAENAPVPREEFLPGMVEQRSTTDLFAPEDFPPEGGTSERIDRISESRQADLRRNRFVEWGVP